MGHKPYRDMVLDGLCCQQQWKLSGMEDVGVNLPKCKAVAARTWGGKFSFKSMLSVGIVPCLTINS